MMMYVNTQNGGTLNLRESASSASQICARIPNGTALEVEVVDNDWAYTTYNQIKGYVMRRYLSDQMPERITKEDLQRIYNSLTSTLKLIDEVLKK